MSAEDRNLEHLDFFIRRKLRVENVLFNDVDVAIPTLKRCVLGGQLVIRYMQLIAPNTEAEKQLEIIFTDGRNAA